MTTQNRQKSNAKKNKNTKAAKRQQIDTPENGEKMLVRKVETINDIENNIASDEVIG